MKEKGMLFSGPMVRAILAGRKTMTRRLINPRWLPGWSGLDPVYEDRNGDLHELAEYSPYHKGDIIYIRETWFNSKPTLYRADERIEDLQITWKPSIFMPKWAARPWRGKITAVRVERVQDITEDDARKEGFASAAVFASYFKSLGKPGRWDDNPYVWVYEFETVKEG